MARRNRNDDKITIRYVEPKYATEEERQAAEARATQALHELAGLLGRMVAQDEIRRVRGEPTGPNLLSPGANSDKEVRVKGRKPSRNAISMAHLNLACRHAVEMMEAGVTENLGIRTLEHFADVYAKLYLGGSAVPHSVKEIPLDRWSQAARAIRAERPDAVPRETYRVEHGTPRRTFARKVLELYRSDKLDEASMSQAVSKYWKLAVITLEEDSRLSKLSKEQFPSPEARWQAAGIVF